MIVGYADGRARISGAAAKASAGGGQCLVLVADVGMGKSTLIGLASTEQRHFRCLRVQGSLSESAFAFAGLHQLVFPSRELLDELPGPQADALRGALGLAPPAGAGRLYIGGALVSLLSLMASDAALLITFDDAHLLDRESLDSFAFAARRVRDDRVLMLFAAEPGDAARSLSDFPTIVLDGLEDAEALALLAHACPAYLAPSVANEIVAATRGCPQALVDIVKLLTPDQLGGRAPLPSPVPLGDALTRSISQHIEHLSVDAQQALLVAAAAGTQTMRVIVPGTPTVQAGLIEAEAQGLVRIKGGQITFRRPLVASMLYHHASDSQRRTVHESLARGLAGESQYSQLRARHLAESTVEPDERVAAEIAESAAAMSARRAHQVAASLYESAANLTPDPGRRVERMLRAAQSCWLAGRSEHTGDLLDRIRFDDLEPEAAADLVLLRLRMARGHGSVMDLSVELSSQSARLEDRAPTKAGQILALMSVDADPDHATALSARGLAMLDRGPPGPDRAIRLLCELAVLYAQLRQRDADEQQVDPPTWDGADGAVDAQTLTDLADLMARMSRVSTCLSTDLIRTVVTLVRLHAVVGLPAMLLVQAQSELDAGRWREADVSFAEAERLSEEFGQDRVLASALAGSATLAALRSDEGAFRRRLDALSGRTGVSASDVSSAVAAISGLHGVGLQDPVGASALLDVDDPVRLLPRQAITALDRAEAARLVGRAGATRMAAEPAAVRLWSAAMTEQPCSVEGLGAALDCADAGEYTPYLVGRLALSLGEQLRRQGQRGSAKLHLHRAFDIFEELRAEVWLVRAEREIHACGDRPRRRRSLGIDQLTPQELQVALVVANGATYREAAAQLFLSPKTIEYHLSKVYSKLGIRSRRELPDALADGQVDR